MPGAIERANELRETTPDAVMPGQFENPANPLVHEKTTAEEIWNDTHGKVDVARHRRRHGRHAHGRAAAC